MLRGVSPGRRTHCPCTTVPTALCPHHPQAWPPPGNPLLLPRESSPPRPPLAPCSQSPPHLPPLPSQGSTWTTPAGQLFVYVHPLGGPRFPALNPGAPTPISVSGYLPGCPGKHPPHTVPGSVHGQSVCPQHLFLPPPPFQVYPEPARLPQAPRGPHPPLGWPAAEPSSQSPTQPHSLSPTQPQMGPCHKGHLAFFL